MPIPEELPDGTGIIIDVDETGHELEEGRHDDGAMIGIRDHQGTLFIAARTPLGRQLLGRSGQLDTTQGRKITNARHLSTLPSEQVGLVHDRVKKVLGNN